MGNFMVEKMSSNLFITFHTPDIKGESEDQSNENAIDVLSWSHSFTQPTTAAQKSSGTVEQANHSDFSFAKYLDVATPDILKYCWSGKPFKKAVFSAYRSDGENKPQKYLEITFSDVIITNVAVGGGTGDRASETITLSYAAVNYQYTYRDHNGHPKASPNVQHDLVQRKIS